MQQLLITYGLARVHLLGGHVFVSKCTNKNEVFLHESTSVARMQAKHFVKFTKFEIRNNENCKI